MITGEIKNQIDQIWDTFFVAGLSINKYKEVEREKVGYGPVGDILSRLGMTETEYTKGYGELVKMLEE